VITTEVDTKVATMGGTISTDKALVLSISALHTDQHKFTAVGVVMEAGAVTAAVTVMEEVTVTEVGAVTAVGITSNGTRSDRLVCKIVLLALIEVFVSPLYLRPKLIG